MRRKIKLTSGTVVGRYRHGSVEKLVALLTLSTAEWDEMTAHLKDLDRFCTDDTDRPDMPLEARIEHFLDLEAAEWLARTWPSDLVGRHSDLNDDVPF